MFLEQFAGHAKFSTWLTRIAVNESLARLKRARLFRIGDPDSMQEETSRVEPGPNPEEELTSRQLKELLQSVIESLPREYRIVFVLRQLQGLSTEETSECLQITEEAVKTRLHRARGLLRRKIDARIGAGIRRLYQFDGQRCDRIVTGVLATILKL